MNNVHASLPSSIQMEWYFLADRKMIEPGRYHFTPFSLFSQYPPFKMMLMLNHGWLCSTPLYHSGRSRIWLSVTLNHRLLGNRIKWVCCRGSLCSVSLKALRQGRDCRYFLNHVSNTELPPKRKVLCLRLNQLYQDLRNCHMRSRLHSGVCCF